jgi:hypothetical protein
MEIPKIYDREMFAASRESGKRKNEPSNVLDHLLFYFLACVYLRLAPDFFFDLLSLFISSLLLS